MKLIFLLPSLPWGIRLPYLCPLVEYNYKGEPCLWRRVFIVWYDTDSSWSLDSSPGWDCQLRFHKRGNSHSLSSRVATLRALGWVIIIFVEKEGEYEKQTMKYVILSRNNENSWTIHKGINFVDSETTPSVFNSPWHRCFTFGNSYFFLNDDFYNGPYGLGIKYPTPIF